MTHPSPRPSSLLLLLWIALVATGCFAPLEEDLPEEALESAEQASEISTSCGNLYQAPCGNRFTGTYCHYNLYKFQAYPSSPTRCLCESPSQSFTWAGPSLGCVFRGCYNRTELARKVRSFQARSDLGTVTRDHVYDIDRDIDVGPYINSTTFLYRATSYSNEIASMETQRKTYRRTPSWPRIGPQVTDANRDAVTIPFQLLAISNSDEPKSQFSSVALTYDVAKTFASGDGYVYALKLNPKSHIFGLDDCDAGELTGELQVQVANGTEIKALRRKKASGGAWEYHNKKQQKWLTSKCNRNNPLWECSSADVKDEL